MTKKELQEEIAELRNNGFTVSAMTEQQLKVALEKGEQLEKENAELKNKLEHRNCLDCSNHSSKLRMRTLELEKENAELKETLRTYNGCGDWDNDFHTCRVYLQHEELQEYIEQLTKAKEIIKAYYEDNFDEAEFYSLQRKAEQFLKEM